MAPEVLNRHEYSNKADIWSLGCVLFELTTLNHPTYEQVGAPSQGASLHGGVQARNEGIRIKGI